MQLTVHTAVIEHRHGINTYAATTREELHSDLATYCRENWEAEMGDDPGEPPDGIDDVIDAYFDQSEFHNEYLETNEHFLTLPGVLPAVTDRQHATILAALRLYQSELQYGGVEEMENMDQFSPDCRPLSDLETEDLIQLLNFPDQSPATPADEPQPAP